MRSPAHKPTPGPEPSHASGSNQRAKPSCPLCGDLVEHSGTGRPRRWCSDRCRVEAHKERARLRNELHEQERLLTLARAQGNEAMVEHREARIAAIGARLTGLTGR